MKYSTVLKDKYLINNISKSKKEVETTPKIVGLVPPYEGNEKQSVAGTGLPKISKEEKKIADKAIRTKTKNENRIVNKAKTDEELRFKKMRAAYEKMGWYMIETKKLNKSQKKTKELKAEFQKIGIILTDEECRMIKKEDKIQSNIRCQAQEIRYFNTMPQRTNGRGMMLILTIMVTRAAAKLPKNARAAYDKVATMVVAQTGNISGYFGVPFPETSTMNDKNLLLDGAITNFANRDGTGSAEGVEAAVVQVKTQVDLYVVFINNMCVADPENAEAIVVASKLDKVKVRVTGTKPDFRIKQGATGEVILISLAGKVDGQRVPTTYYWQYGLNVAGVLTWYDLPDTVNKCQTKATGMPTDTVVYFRKATNTTKGGRSAWCAPKTISPV